MKLSSLLRFFLILGVFVALAFWPQAALAQHGGGHGGGGGGFHGGGGGFHSGAAFSGGHAAYSAPRSYGGYHGGGYYGHAGYYGHGWYGGYHGWYGGRYWGYPYYGWGWGFGWGWPYYGYSYYPWGYPTYYYSYPTNLPPSDPNTDPNNYPYQCPPGYSCIQDQRDNPPPGDPPANNAPGNGRSRPTPSSLGNPNPWRTPSNAPSPQNANPGDGNLPPAKESFDMGPGRVLSVDRLVPDAIVATPAMYLTTPASKPLYGPLRPEVVRAMRQLHEMPPYAREREISTGRYSNFSTEEKQLLRSVR